MLAHAEGMRIRRDVAHEFALRRALGSECQNGLDFRVLREAASAIERNGRARRIDLVSTLMILGERLSYTMHIAQEKIGGVDEHRGILAGLRGALRLHLETGENRLREGLADGELLSRVAR